MRKLNAMVLSSLCMLVAGAAFPSASCAQAKTKDPTYQDMIAAYQKGDKEMAYPLGASYASGLNGAPHSYKKANEWFSKAAANGNALAAVKLGDASFYGYGTAVSKPTALKWYNKAALLGDTEGQEKLGDMYSNADGTKQDYGMAVKWYQKAAEGGGGIACSKLGWLYLSGYGVKADNAAALKWYTKGYELGDYTAAVFISNIYWGGGKGVKKNLSKSTEWLVKGAVEGDPSAMRKLAKAYMAGEGIRRDNAEAYKWLTVVTQKGKDPAAESLMRDIERKLGAAELAKAKKQAAGLVAKYVDEKDRANKKYEKTHKGL